jgi:Flp pilus assembly protein TadD
MNSISLKVFVFASGLAIVLGGCAGMLGTIKSAKDKGTDSSTKSSPASPTNREFARAVSLLKDERYQEAEPLLIKLTQGFPNSSGPLTNLGIVYLRTDRPDEAVSTFKKLLSLNPKNPTGHNYLGVAYRTKGEFDNARKAYEQAVSADPTFSAAYLNLGILYDLYLSQPNKALSYYEKFRTLATGDDTQRVEKWIAEVQRRSKSAVNQGGKQ